MTNFQMNNNNWNTITWGMKEILNEMNINVEIFLRSFLNSCDSTRKVWEVKVKNEKIKPEHFKSSLIDDHWMDYELYFLKLINWDSWTILNALCMITKNSNMIGRFILFWVRFHHGNKEKGNKL
jgi:hypothetical protein